MTLNNESSNVISIADIKPKVLKLVYKKVPIKLIYNPITKKWKWYIEIVTKTQYSEISDTEARALKDAQKYIDKHELGE